MDDDKAVLRQVEHLHVGLERQVNDAVFLGVAAVIVSALFVLGPELRRDVLALALTTAFAFIGLVVHNHFGRHLVALHRHRAAGPILVFVEALAHGKELLAGLAADGLIAQILFGVFLDD